jgi:hypothetical protein
MGNGVAHLACPFPDVAGEALLGAVAALGDEGGTVCVPGPHPGLAALLRNGFTVVDYDMHMRSEPSLVPTTWAYSSGLG